MPATLTRKNPAWLRKYIRSVDKLAGREVKVGWSVELGTPPETVAIAAINALGGSKGDNPWPRPTLEPMLKEEANSLRGFSTKAAALANRGKDPEPVLQAEAKFLQRRLEVAVQEMFDPPNAASTVEQKGFDNPLIGAGSDGGRILAGVRAAVVSRKR